MDCKTCTKCGESKPLDAFKKDQTKPTGRSSWCKSCAKACAAASYAADPNPARNRNAAWRSANKELHRARCAEWAAANPERVRVRRADWYRMNVEHMRAKNRASVEQGRPGYVAQAMRISVSDLTPDLLALKREQLEVHRLLKTFKTQLNKEPT